MNSNKYKTHWILLFATIFFNPAINFAQVEGECDSLISPCENTFSLNGFYIDLEAVSGNILIHSFHTLTQNGGARDVDLYYKAGTYLGAEGDPLLWNFVGSTTDFDPQFGPSCPLPYTEIPIVANVCIPQGNHYSFYLMRSGGTGTFEANDLVPPGQVVVQNPMLKLYSSEGTQDFSPFGTDFLRDSMTFQGKIQYSCGCTPSAVQTLDLGYTRVFPNPASDVVNVDVSFLDIEQGRIEIINLTGHVLLEQNFQHGSDPVQVNIQSFPKGVYWINIKDNKHPDRVIFSRKLIK